MTYQRTDKTIHKHFKELQSVRTSTDDSCFIVINVHYYSNRFNRVETYSRPHDFSERSDILDRLKQTIEVDQGVKIATIHATTKHLQLIDDEDLYVAVLFFYDTVAELSDRRRGMDIYINGAVVSPT